MQCFWVLNLRIIDAGEACEICMAAILGYTHWFIIHIVFISIALILALLSYCS